LIFLLVVVSIRAGELIFRRLALVKEGILWGIGGGIGGGIGIGGGGGGGGGGGC
jgi:hypothetical protein